MLLPQRKRKKQLLIKIGMLRRYICILINKMKGHRMPVPPTPYIHGRDPSIRRHELEYMLIPPRPVSSWEFIPLDDLAWGPILDQAPFQVLGYALGSSAYQADPSAGLIVGDDADGGSVEHFARNTFRDNDSPQANRVFLYHYDVALTQECFIFLVFFRHCPSVGQICMYYTIPQWAQTVF